MTSGFINSSKSVLGKHILEWIAMSKADKTPEEQIISSKLYHKYVKDRDGNDKNKIYPNVYYYVNYNNNINENIYLAYIVRDKAKSPRNLPEAIINLDILSSDESFRGSIISEWSYYHNGSAENQYFMEGNEIVTHYLEGSHPLRRNVYYFVQRTQKGIKIFRDTNKSPREWETNIEMEV